MATSDHGETNLNPLQKFILSLALVLAMGTSLPGLAAPQRMPYNGLMTANNGAADDLADATAGGARPGQSSIDTTAGQSSSNTADGQSSSDTADGQSNSSTASPKSTKLQGGVSHAEEMPGLPEGLRIGKAYSDDLLQGAASQSNSDWYYIPAWYAGVRHSEDAMIVYRYDFATGEESNPMLRQLNRQDSRAGYQVDKNGGIWDYKHIPMIQHVESDDCNAILYLRSLTPISGSDDRLVIKYNEVSISVSKRTNKILRVVQQEQINTVSSPIPGTLRVDVSVKSFTADGKPERQEQSVMITKITKPFEKIDELNGQDLRPLFRDYLISHNLEKLMPPDLAK